MTSVRRRYTVHDVDNTVEELILTGLIVSDIFTKRIRNSINIDFFKSKPIQLVAKWAVDYYDDHGESPKETINEVFEIESRNNKDLANRDQIEALLNKISDTYQSSTQFNDSYIFQKGTEYFRRRSLEIMVQEINYYLGKNDIMRAEDSYHGRAEILPTMITAVDPLSNFAVESWYEKVSEELFRFPGDLGDYLAPIQRGKLIGVVGPPKRGKSAWMIEFMVQAAMHKLKVMFYSLEMSMDEVNYRIGQRITATEKFDDEDERMYVYPVADCIHNQTDECDRPERESKVGLSDSEGNMISLEESIKIDYKACSACKNVNKLYEYAMWKVVETKKCPTLGWIKTKVLQFENMFGKENMQVECFPINTFSVDDLDDHLEMMEREKNFIPDVIIIDYADIMKKPKMNERRHQLGDIWENLSRIAKTKNALVVTASQGNRGSAYKEDLDMADVAEDFSKAMIVDMLLGLNQTGQEKADEVQRIAILNHRYRGFNPFRQCQIYQCRSLGQVCLDSRTFVKNRPKGKRNKT